MARNEQLGWGGIEHLDYRPVVFTGVASYVLDHDINIFTLEPLNLRVAVATVQPSIPSTM